MNLTAKPIVDGKFWIVEENGEKIAVLHKKEGNKYMLSSKQGETYFAKKDELVKTFGKDFFQINNKKSSEILIVIDKIIELLFNNNLPALNINKKDEKIIKYVLKVYKSYYEFKALPLHSRAITALLVKLDKN